MEAFLFDLYPTEQGVLTFWTTKIGETHQALTTNIKGAIYLQPYSKINIYDMVRQLKYLEQDDNFGCTIKIKQKHISLHHPYKTQVIELQIPLHNYTSIYQRILKDNLPVSFFNTELAVPQLFFLETGLFPFCKADIMIKGGKLVNYKLVDDIKSIVYELPPVKALSLSFKFESTLYLSTPLQAILTPMNQNINSANKNDKMFSNESIYIEKKHSESEFYQELVTTINELNPDIIVTSGGDRELRFLATRATELGLGSLTFNQDKFVMPFSRQSRSSAFGNSYMSYGMMFYKDKGFYLYGGRHHFDLRNSFTWSDGGFAGIVELSRLSCMDPQAACRGSIGTLLTGMQILEALRTDILIPGKKAGVELFRSGTSLLDSDRGGFIVSPRVGLHFNVLEVDFLSMFPTIMVNFNISPETMNCYCCSDGSGLQVPQSHYYTCTKHKGLIPRVLDHILQRRVYYKQRKKENPKYDQLQKTLKWILVTSFGYLGYRNARWGRIDAHESINAYAREKILTIIDLAEESNLECVAGIVDSLWMKHLDESKIDESLPTSMTTKGAELTNLPISIEGIYKWIVFLPRLDEPEVGVLNRYYGVYQDGSMKVRGIEIRKRDTPLFIKSAQQEALDLFAEADNRSDFKFKIKNSLPQLYMQWKQKLIDQTVPLEQLIVSKTLSKNPQDYRANNHSALVSKQLVKEGVHLQSGMKVQYIVTDHMNTKAHERVKPLQKVDPNSYQDEIDIEWYSEKLDKAFKNIIPPEYYTRTKKNSKKKAITSYF